jgi:hypothetical protein
MLACRVPEIIRSLFAMGNLNFFMPEEWGSAFSLLLRDAKDRGMSFAREEAGEATAPAPDLDRVPGRGGKDVPGASGDGRKKCGNKQSASFVCPSTQPFAAERS